MVYAAARRVRSAIGWTIDGSPTSGKTPPADHRKARSVGTATHSGLASGAYSMEYGTDAVTTLGDATANGDFFG